MCCSKRKDSSGAPGVEASVCRVTLKKKITVVDWLSAASTSSVDSTFSSTTPRSKPPTTTSNSSTSELEQIFRTNVFAPFWLCRAAVPRMQAGAVIINTVSIQAFAPSPHLLACGNQGRACQFHQGPRRQRRIARHPGQRRRAWTRGDAADPLDDGCGEGSRVRRQHGLWPRRAARRARAAVRLSGVERVPFCDRRSLWGDRRPPYSPGDARPGLSLGASSYSRMVN
jgi:NAD(P)-dependent dehydrogenase (short-subunit alcohol dehydrogenase family)